ncbi:MULTISPECIES: DinB family protein [unclassified Bacillus (in: firmicutes)]|uniref:DinB family protein n=1 Tax=unclassified Bacillus (in: firmicutes) TaxID=185979 RepID=UPI0008E97066|nr:MULTISPECIES: DinB family protein [unclassified Bacillus (in: firmicutes)]SFB20509.1 DinB superfamily protein [Bacillus sp. UNCCL13]SFQ90879.1 DinB superfamily protein [Bacillus sp. cl95]
MSFSFFEKGLHGENAHVDPLEVFEGLRWEMAGEKPENCPYSVWQILNHMIFWQDFYLTYLHGSVPVHPEQDEDSWPDETAPSNETEWSDTFFQFSKGLKEADNEAKKDLNVLKDSRLERTRGDILATLMAHNSYHTGQVALIRQLIGAWPPPSWL